VKLAVGSLVLASGLVLSSLCAAPAARAANPFMLKSPTLEDNAPLPAKDAGNNKQNPNCVGDNISPPLAWSDPPEGTKSFALLMFDPEGRGGLGVSHMVTYGIAASVTGFAEGELSNSSDNMSAARAQWGWRPISGRARRPVIGITIRSL
jgi:phosphatidylethanolamine-binding protein (PEBP) family uncharacterized protein